jgi:hypothetical protein
MAGKTNTFCHKLNCLASFGRLPDSAMPPFRGQRDPHVIRVQADTIAAHPKID